VTQPLPPAPQQPQEQQQPQPQPPGEQKLSDQLLEKVREANAQSVANLLSKGGR
jgi:hypothetical protein